MNYLRINTPVALILSLFGLALASFASADNQTDPSSQGIDSEARTELNRGDRVLSVDGTGLGIMGAPDGEAGTESVDGTGRRPSVDGTGVRHRIPSNTGTSIGAIVAQSDGIRSVDGTGLQQAAMPVALRGNEEALPDCPPAAEGEEAEESPEGCVPASN